MYESMLHSLVLYVAEMPRTCNNSMLGNMSIYLDTFLPVCSPTPSAHISAFICLSCCAQGLPACAEGTAIQGGAGPHQFQKALGRCFLSHP